MIDEDQVLLTISHFKIRKGGLAHYYRAVLPYLQKLVNLKCLEIGAEGKRKFHFVLDQIYFNRKLKNKSIKLVHINPSLTTKSFLRDGFFAWQAKKNKKKLLVFFHGWEKIFERKIDNNSVLKKFFLHTFGKADAFIVLASDFKNKFREWGIKVPIYVETTAVEEKLVEGFNIQEKLKNFSQKEIINFLFLARLEKEKGIMETIDVFDTLKKEGLKIKLIIAGDGSYREEVLKKINKSPYRNNIEYVGYVKGEKKKEVFKKSHVYIFPTYYGEGMPTSVLEAMCFGCFIVTTDVGGLKDLWRRHKWGIQVKVEDVKNGKLSNLIKLLKEGLLKDRKMVVNAMQKNYLYGINNFLGNKIALRLKNIYDEIVKFK